MSLAERLDAALKEAMRHRQADVVACIRQVKSKVQEATNASGFVGPLDDALVQRVVTSYVKSLEKAIAELAAGGERSRPLVARYRSEITYLHPYLPAMLAEGDTRMLVEQTIAELGITDAKQGGQVVGALVKTHRGQIDAAMVRQLVESLLA